MLFPVGVTPPPRRTAWANLGLIMVNVAVFVLITLPLSSRPADLDDPAAQHFVIEMARASGQDPYEIARHATEYDIYTFIHGFRPAAPDLQALFCAMFLHAGLLHLAGNMLFLGIFGGHVEERLGPAKYVLAYLATGAVATIVHAMFVEQAGLPMIGASGAISGVLGFYFVWFPRHQVKMLLWFYFFATVVLIPARVVLGFYLLVENALPFLLSSGAGGVAYGAHLGGFLAGWLLAHGAED